MTRVTYSRVGGVESKTFPRGRSDGYRFYNVSEKSEAARAFFNIHPSPRQSARSENHDNTFYILTSNPFVHDHVIGSSIAVMLSAICSTTAESARISRRFRILHRRSSKLRSITTSSSIELEGQVRKRIALRIISIASNECCPQANQSTTQDNWEGCNLR